METIAFDSLRQLPGITPPDAGHELRWLDDALGGAAHAAVWQGPRSLVVPLSYRRFAGFDAACELSAARGWPVRVRRSGGGVVPQGDGVLNFSLAFPMDDGAGRWMTQVYLMMCDVLGRAFRSLGVTTRLGEVPGAFCDGRYNLAVRTADPRPAGRLRKLVGTAQYWRRRDRQHAVLAHAIVLLDADIEAMTATLNDFEATLQRGRPYDAAAVTTLGRCLDGRLAGEALRQGFVAALADALGPVNYRPAG